MIQKFEQTLSEKEEKLSELIQKLNNSEQKITTLIFERKEQEKNFKTQLDELDKRHQNLNNLKSDPLAEENKKLSSLVTNLKVKIEDLEIDIGDYELKTKLKEKEYDKHMEENKKEKKTLEVDF